jgi:hypothetical protein
MIPLFLGARLLTSRAFFGGMFRPSLFPGVTLRMPRRMEPFRPTPFAPMGRGPRLTVRPVPGDEPFTWMSRPIFRASDEAMRETVRLATDLGRASIAGAGMSRRFQNALRGNVYVGREARNAIAAGFIYHRVPWAGVHEDGATIHGSPRLFIPLKGTPKRVRGNRRMTVENYRIAGLAPLFPIKSRSGQTLLAAKLRLPRSQAEAREPRVTMAALRRGSGDGRGMLRSVPLFVGVRQVTIRPRINVRGAVQQAASELPRLYFNHLDPDA